jgi:polyhydroxybutyrate depolymerase
MRLQKMIPATLIALLAFANANAETLTHDGLTRRYVVRAPAAKAGVRVPLVVVLHGGGGNAANAEQMTGFTAKARKEGFIVVYPDGTGPIEGRLLTWNVRHCCGYAMKNDVDDVGFIRALIETLESRYPIDPHRIYATGMSNGAMMAHRLGIELSDRLAGIAPVVGTLFGDEQIPSHPVAALMINGMLDENVPWQGGPGGGRGARSWDGTPTQPGLAQLEFWSHANGCAVMPGAQQQERWTSWSGDCPGHADVALYLLKDNGHAWPGGNPGSKRGDTPSSAMNATDVIWDFFQKHPR